MLDYKLIRSNRKTICITVETNSKITVKAPYFASKSEIDEFVLKKSGWINTALRREAEKIKPPAFCDGAEYLIAGRRYTVNFYSGKRAHLRDDCIFIPPPSVLGGEACRSEFLKAIKKIFLPFVTERTRRFSEAIGLRFKSVALSSAKTRWGSCNGENAIRYSLYLAFLPIELIDYVILHELCHVRQKNHSLNFWSLVCYYMPDYAKRRTNLRNYSCFLDF